MLFNINKKTKIGHKQRKNIGFNKSFTMRYTIQKHMTKKLNRERRGGRGLALRTRLNWIHAIRKIRSRGSLRIIYKPHVKPFRTLHTFTLIWNNNQHPKTGNRCYFYSWNIYQTRLGRVRGPRAPQDVGPGGLAPKTPSAPCCPVGATSGNEE